MTRADGSEIDADELMTGVRDEVARGSAPANGSPTPSRATPDTAAEEFAVEDEPSSSLAHETLSLELPILPPPADIPPLCLQPEFGPSPDDRYHINDLLQYHDRHFVENAYLATLKRSAEAGEIASDVGELRSGHIGKRELVERLLLSPEGRRAKVEVRGRGSSIANRLTRIPVLGYWLRLAKGLLRLPIMMQHQQQFELYALAQQQLIADHINEAVERITEQRREMYKALTAHQREGSKVFTELSEIIADLYETCGMLAEALAEASTSSKVLAELPTEVASMRRQIKELIEAQQSLVEIDHELLIH